jgi:hypothetical protein
MGMAPEVGAGGVEVGAPGGVLGGEVGGFGVPLLPLLLILGGAALVIILALALSKKK